MRQAILLGTAFFGGAVVTFLLTPLVIALWKRARSVDRPRRGRRSTDPRPCLGGAAVFAGLLVGALAYGLAFGWDSFFALFRRDQHLSLLFGCGMVFALGLADDTWDVPPVARVLIEAMASIALIQAGYLVDAIWTPWGAIELGLVAYPVTLLWFVGITNAFNLVDGLDGLLSTVGIACLLGCTGVGLLVGMPGTSFLPVALAGALAGFLPWNWHRARILLGDAGSLFVGFTAAAISLKVSRYVSGGVALHVMVALCALPVLETFLTLARRYVSGRLWFSGDREHIHHVLVHKGLTVPKAVVALGLLQVLFSGMAVFSRMRLRWYSTIPVGVLLLLVALGIRWLDYVELRVLWHRFVRLLSHRRRRVLPSLVGMARAGDVVRGAESPAALQDALAEIVRGEPLVYLALEFSELGVSIVGRDSLRAEVHNREAAAYLAGLDTRACWLFSAEEDDRTEPSAMRDSARFVVVLPAEDGRYGRLVCQRKCEPWEGGLTHSDVQRYLARPVAEVLRRLEGSRHEAVAKGASADGRDSSRGEGPSSASGA